MLIAVTSDNKDLLRVFKNFYLTLSLKRFSDGGFSLEDLPDLPKSQKLFLIHSIKSDRDFSELLVILSCYSVKTVCFPYNAYLRNSYGADFIVNTLKKFGVQNIVTIDGHTYNKGIININVFNFWKNLLGDSYTFVSPDEGSLTRNAISDVKLIKKHKINGGVYIIESSGEIHNKKCLIVDDIIDTGATINAASKFLFENGAQSVTVAATHAILSKQFTPLQKIRRILVTNTIKNQTLPEKFQVIDVSEFLLTKVLGK